MIQIKEQIIRRHSEESFRAGETSQENKQLRLRRRRKDKRARPERDNPDQSELRRKAQRRQSQEQKADTPDSRATSKA